MVVYVVLDVVFIVNIILVIDVPIVGVGLVLVVIVHLI